MTRGQWQPALVAAAIPTFQRELSAAVGWSQVLILLPQAWTGTDTPGPPSREKGKGLCHKITNTACTELSPMPCPEKLPVGAAFPEHPDPEQSRSPQNVPDLPARHNKGVEERKN